MPTIKDKIYFNLGGVGSDQFGLIHIVTDNGMYDEVFVATRDLNETKIRGNSKPMLHSVEESPIEFEMSIAFEDKFTDSNIDAVIRWLFVDHYRPLYFEGREDRVYMAMIIGSPRIIHNGVNEGYFTVNVRCDSSQIYSPFITSNLETVTGTKEISVMSDSHFDVYPEISIKKTGVGHITIESLDDYGNIFEVRDLTNMEDIYINCEKEIIETDLLGTYRYNNIVGDFPRLLFGLNRFKITGDCTIQFRYKNKYRF